MRWFRKPAGQTQAGGRRSKENSSFAETGSPASAVRSGKKLKSIRRLFAKELVLFLAAAIIVFLNGWPPKPEESVRHLTINPREGMTVLVRCRPDDQAPVLGRIDRPHTQVSMLETNETWTAVQVLGVTGYIRTNCWEEKSWHLHPYRPEDNRIRWYRQRDADWDRHTVGNRLFGDTGCVPTAYAMALTYLSGISITPPDVGDLLYAAGTYNDPKRNGFGTNPEEAAPCISSIYGLNLQVTRKAECVRTALKNDELVLISVEPSKWSSENHCMLLAGLDDKDRTQVFNPAGSQRGDWCAFPNLAKDARLFTIIENPNAPAETDAKEDQPETDTGYTENKPEGQSSSGQAIETKPYKDVDF